MSYLPTAEKMSAIGARTKWGNSTWTLGGFPEKIIEINAEDITITAGEIGCSCGTNLDNPIDFVLPSEQFFDELLVAMKLLPIKP